MGLLDRLEQRSSPENPTTSLANPDQWLWDAWGASPTKAGASVSPRSALAMSAVFACIRVIAETLATIPLVVYERLEKGKRRASEHPLWTLLHDKPNPEMTSVTLIEALQGHICAWGNAYAEIELNGAGRPVALWPLLPDRTRAVRYQGKRVFLTTVQDQNGQPKDVVLPAHRVLHIPGLGFDGYCGYSPITLAKQAIGLGLAAEEFGARFFSNGAHTGLLFKHPAKLNDLSKKRIREGFEYLHQGLAQSHRIGVLEEGMDVVKLGIPQEDAQFLQTRTFQIVEVARFHRMPLHKIQEYTHATFSNVEHLGIEFATDTMRPHAVRFEKAVNTHEALFTTKERGVYFCEFLMDGLLRGDLGSRYTAYNTGRSGGWLSPNDIRELENQNPLPEGQGGDVYLTPANMVPSDKIGMAPPAPKPDPAADPVATKSVTGRDLEHACGRVLGALAARLARREAGSVGRLLTKPDPAASLDAFYADFTATVRGEFATAEGAFPMLLPLGFAQAAATRWVNDSREQLLPLAGDRSAIECRLESWVETRPAYTVQSELARIQGGSE